jgi:TPR repeat protein
MYSKGSGVPRDYGKAAEWVERSAKQGHREAETALGDLYLGGWGVRQDDHLAAFWLQKGASQGDPTAQTKLGLLYLNGRGVAHDDALGATWLSQAAEQDQHEAQAKLALLYEWGRGVPRDLNRAYFWRRLSIDGSNSERSDQLHDLARSMSAENVAAAERHVSEWRETHPAKSPADKSSVGVRTVQ